MTQTSQDYQVRAAFLGVGKALEKAFLASEERRLTDAEMNNFRSAVYDLELILTASGGRGQVYLMQMSFQPRVQRALGTVHFGRVGDFGFPPIRTVSDLLQAKFYAIRDIPSLGSGGIRNMVEVMRDKGFIPTRVDPVFVSNYPIQRAGSKTFLQVILESITQEGKDAAT